MERKKLLQRRTVTHDSDDQIHNTSSTGNSTGRVGSHGDTGSTGNVTHRGSDKHTNPLSDMKSDLEPIYGTDIPDKNPVGRPTDYSPAVHDIVLKMGNEGKSITQMAKRLNVARSTIYVWAKEHKEFSDTLDRAMTASESWWEEQAHIGIGQPAKEFNTGLFGKIMSARFPATYREVTNTQHSGLNGGPIPLAVANVPITGEGLKDFYKQFMDGNSASTF